MDGAGTVGVQLPKNAWFTKMVGVILYSGRNFNVLRNPERSHP
jgi:hypothetical protein